MLSKSTPAKCEPDPIPAQAPRTPVELKRVIEALPDDAIPELNESRARREHYQAELAKLQVAQQRRELVPADEVKKDAFQIGRSIREALANLRWPQRHAASWVSLPSNVSHQLCVENRRRRPGGIAASKIQN